jgi:hypothetical protein
VTDDIQAAVIADNLEVSVIRCQPAVFDRDDVDLALTHRQAPRRFFAPVAGIAIDPDIHLSAGYDNSRVIAFFVLLLLLHFPDLFHHLAISCCMVSGNTWMASARLLAALVWPARAAVPVG